MSGAPSYAETAAEREIWEYLNAHPALSNADIARATSAGPWVRENYLRRLKRRGILRVAKHVGRTPFYTVFDTIDVADYTAARRGSKEAAMWQAIRALDIFTPYDVRAALAGIDDISLRDVQSYCSMLVRIKYLAVLTRARSETSPARYKLTKNTGPLPPVQKRVSVVIDGNEDRIVYAGGERL